MKKRIITGICGMMMLSSLLTACKPHGPLSKDMSEEEAIQYATELLYRNKDAESPEELVGGMIGDAIEDTYGPISEEKETEEETAEETTEETTGEETVEENTKFTVELTEMGPNKVQVIKVVRELTGLGLKEAKELVESAPVIIIEDVTKEEAEDIKVKFEAEGAVASINAMVEDTYNSASDGEETWFAVELTEIGPNKVQVIKVVRDLTGLGLKEAKELVESAPVVIIEVVTKEEAEDIRVKFEAVGAKAALK